MANRRMTMRKIRETLRLRHEAGMSVRQISTHTDTSVGAIQNLLNKAARAGVGWPLPEELADEALVKLLYPSRSGSGRGEFQLPEWSTVHQELKRKDMTLQLLWEEYIAQHPGRCYSYSQFCALFVSWRARQKRSMRQTHRFGEKSFVDYWAAFTMRSMAKCAKRRYSLAYWAPPTTPPKRVGGRRRSGWPVIRGW